jgi:hypothetical protein
MMNQNEEKALILDIPVAPKKKPEKKPIIILSNE